MAIAVPPVRSFAHSFAPACPDFSVISKQRTVRTMSPDMNWLEKIVLVATFSIWICIGIASWLIQG